MPTGPELATMPSPVPYPIISHGIQWSQALPATALAGLISGFVMLIPFGAFGIGMIAAGVLGVVFYRRRNPGANLTPGMGARLGAVSGLMGFAIFAILTSLEMLVFRVRGEIRQALLDAIQQSASRANDPQVQQMFDYFKTPAGLALMMILGMAVMFVFFMVFSSAAGAVTAALLGKREQY